jgi:hypothetical protein
LGVAFDPQFGLYKLKSGPFTMVNNPRPPTAVYQALAIQA